MISSSSIKSDKLAKWMKQSQGVRRYQHVLANQDRDNENGLKFSRSVMKSTGLQDCTLVVAGGRL